jgi:hypothetical protein
VNRPPDTIVIRRDRDLAGRGREIWVRRIGVGVLLAVAVVALLNDFGQRPTTPDRVRSGML